ncbi:hypothetical protein VTK26DRAFT_2563 [Humicola hyalothermophila]
MCDTNLDNPFCAPQDGAKVQIGDSIDIKWNPSFFSALKTAPPQIFIQADFPADGRADSGATGFTSPLVDATTGIFTWSILDSHLPQPTVRADAINSTRALLFLAEPPIVNNSHFRMAANRAVRYPGPQIYILRTTDPNSNASTDNPGNGIAPTSQQPQSQQQQQQQQQQPNILAIALPVALGLLTLLLMAGCILLRRKRPDALARFMPRANTMGSKLGGGGGGGGGGWSFAIPFRRRRGYGERQSRAQRSGAVGSLPFTTPGAGVARSGTVRGLMTGGGGGRGMRGGRVGTGVRLQGKEIKVVTTDLDGLRMNAVRLGMGAAEGGVMGMGKAGTRIRSLKPAIGARAVSDLANSTDSNELDPHGATVSGTAYSGAPGKTTSTQWEPECGVHFGKRALLETIQSQVDNLRKRPCRDIAGDAEMVMKRCILGNAKTNKWWTRGQVRDSQQTRVVVNKGECKPDGNRV